MDETDLSRREKLRSLYRVARYRPMLTAAIVLFSAAAAFLEGVGLSFLLPIIETAQSPANPAQSADGAMQVFVTVYQTVGIPLTLGTLVAGVGAVMVVRYASSFAVAWARIALETNYTRHLQSEAFERAMAARVSYFDREGSDEILNAIVTQAEKAGGVIREFVMFFQKLMISLVYLGIALYVSWELTTFALVFFALMSYGVRSVISPGYGLGDRVADANERIQETAQAGTQAIRDVKQYTMADELLAEFAESIDQYATSTVKLGRNEAAISNVYNLVTAVMVFVLIFGAIEFAGLALGSLGVFLFAMFRLGPYVTGMNTRFYKFEGQLPHLARTQAFVAELDDNEELQGGDEPVSEPPTPVAFEDVTFSYGDDDVLRDVSFEIPADGFIAFVGQSGAGKSTVASLLTRMYDPDEGRITADGVPITEFDIDEWRERVAVVTQDPYVFNETLRYNVTLGARDASEERVRRACEVAQVTEFLDELPRGLETELGDDGVRLSGGQRQRIALARALLKDADLLVLDEATSDLDTRIEQRVQRGIEGMDRDYPVVAIAHRLSTVRGADRIFTLEDGRIVEAGRHEDLIDNGGTYGELYAAQ
jgi:subfamily B ATP-binding cassette protein MsbA